MYLRVRRAAAVLELAILSDLIIRRGFPVRDYTLLA
jgi:hypothetical protein